MYLVLQYSSPLLWYCSITKLSYDITFKHELMWRHDTHGINPWFHIDFCESDTLSILAIHVGSLRLAPITCNRPQQVFPRGLLKLLNITIYSTMSTSFCQGLDSSFIHTQNIMIVGFDLLIFTLCISMDTRFPKDHIHPLVDY